MNRIISIYDWWSRSYSIFLHDYVNIKIEIRKNLEDHFQQICELLPTFKKYTPYWYYLPLSIYGFRTLTLVSNQYTVRMRLAMFTLVGAITMHRNSQWKFYEEHVGWILIKFNSYIR